MRSMRARVCSSPSAASTNQLNAFRTADPPVAMLRNFIAINRQAILARAKARVDSRSPPLSGRAESHGLPVFLDQLCASLSRARLPEVVDYQDIWQQGGPRRRSMTSRLLIVDDDFDLVEILSNMLRAHGYFVRTARTGEEGLKVLRSSQQLPDALLLDVDMPVLGGPAMAHKMMLHEVGEERIPIVLWSGRSDLALLAAKMGTPYAIAKPVALDNLLAVLALALRERIAPKSA